MTISGPSALYSQAYLSFDSIGASGLLPWLSNEPSHFITTLPRRGSWSVRWASILVESPSQFRNKFNGQDNPLHLILRYTSASSKIAVLFPRPTSCFEYCTLLQNFDTPAALSAPNPTRELRREYRPNNAVWRFYPATDATSALHDTRNRGRVFWKASKLDPACGASALYQRRSYQYNTFLPARVLQEWNSAEIATVQCAALCNSYPHPGRS
ncbi:hypothetical protein DFH06DRAFT_216192 [Mycena polygramma]|nr:hypothetical protein DFH06DRAFT_216192 [Mycena polygramma]